MSASNPRTIRYRVSFYDVGESRFDVHFVLANLDLEHKKCERKLEGVLPALFYC